jgi:hypothetical protein
VPAAATVRVAMMGPVPLVHPPGAPGKFREFPAEFPASPVVMMHIRTPFRYIEITDISKHSRFQGCGPASRRGFFAAVTYIPECELLPVD